MIVSWLEWRWGGGVVEGVCASGAVYIYIGFGG